MPFGSCWNSMEFSTCSNTCCSFVTATKSCSAGTFAYYSICYCLQGFSVGFHLLRSFLASQLSSAINRIAWVICEFISDLSFASLSYSGSSSLFGSWIRRVALVGGFVLEFYLGTVLPPLGTKSFHTKLTYFLPSFLLNEDSCLSCCHGMDRSEKTWSLGLVHSRYCRSWACPHHWHLLGKALSATYCSWHHYLIVGPQLSDFMIFTIAYF